MLAQSVKYQGFSCFLNNWAGFDEFKPITVIIGRNNSGKSHLLDLVEMMASSKSVQQPCPFQCTSVLDEEFLQTVFMKGKRGGELGGYHWEDHGKLLLDVPVGWKFGTNLSNGELQFPDDFPHPNQRTENARKQKIIGKLPEVKSPLSDKVFRRLLADRDVESEESQQILDIKSNGSGATNVIQRYILSATLPEDLIQVELLLALDEIFGSDGDFEQIEVRDHEVSEDHQKIWEVFLKEPRKGLIPLSRSGSGLKTVILVLLNLLVIPEYEKKETHQFVFAFEELENNLHPSLLRRLFRFIADYVAREGCFVFLTTHSNIALDFFGTRPDAQLIHVSHDGESASANTITAHFERVGLMNELGAKPSDLLQANGVIWLEGPSDRIYLNRFIELFSGGKLREGRDYQCAFYGGAVLAKTEFASPDKSDGEFANLLRLNNNVAVICDGDRTAATGEGSRPKKRVQRIKSELDQIQGAMLWITDAKEIENYVPGEVWKKVYKASKEVPDPDKYDKFPTGKLGADAFVNKHLKQKSFDKCEVASAATPYLSKSNLQTRFELKSKMDELVALIKKWNE